MNALPADSIILVADDDDDDFLLLQKAFQWVDIEVEVRRAHDGVQLLEMLRRHGLADRVLLILMDLNMPRKDGRESIRELKSDPRLRAIPIVVLTNSHDEGDAALSYELGANSFLFKPFSFQELVARMSALKNYWLESAELPCKRNPSAT